MECGIKKLYTRMRPEAKQSFWTVITNIFLVAFTFWMGIYVQDIVASRNSQYNARLARIEYMEKVKPRYEALLSEYYTQWSFIANIIKGIDPKDIANAKYVLNLPDVEIPIEYYYSATPDSLIAFCKDVLELGSEYQIYVTDKKDRKAIKELLSEQGVFLFVNDLYKSGEYIKDGEIDEGFYVGDS